jgi:SOS-response transcriptional repressor LexA
MHKTQEKLLKLSETMDLGKLSLRQIGKMIGLEHSPQAVKHHLLQLEKNGFVKIKRADKLIEGIHISVAKKNSLFAVPILGGASAGPAEIFVDQNIDGYLRISSKLLNKRKGIFAVKIYGKSMNKADINGQTIDDGDFVIVDSEERTPRNGDYVLSVIDGVANVKKYYNDPENDRIVLMSESTINYAPIFIHKDDLEKYLVNGKVVQVIKNPKI